MVRGLADIGAEGVLLAGAGRAILLQLADPAVGRGVAGHSNFSERPLDRLLSTMSYVYAVVYGNEAQLAAVRRKVNRAHAPVRSPSGAGGQAGAGPDGYSAFDAHSQLWVVATLYDTAATVYQKIYGPLDDEAAELVYRDYARIGTALQLPPEMWPADRAAFARYWNERLPALKIEEATRAVARDLLYPAGGPLWLRLSMPLARFLTAGLLPGHLRSGFGLPWSERHGRRFDRTMRVSATVYPRLPKRLRHWIKNYCLGRLVTA